MGLVRIYTTVDAFTLYGLDQRVNEFIDSGGQPFGGVCFGQNIRRDGSGPHRDVFIQAMVKYQEQQNGI